MALFNKLFIATLLASLLFVGCVQVPGTGEPVTQNTSQIQPDINQTLPLGPGPEISSTVGNETTNYLTNASVNTTNPEQPSYSTYDLSITGLSTSPDPTISYYVTISVDVECKGKKKPAGYKISYYLNDEYIASQTVLSPAEKELVEFQWFAVQDKEYTLKADVETFTDEQIAEEGPTSNNEMETTFTILPIETKPTSTGTDILADAYIAQQFTVGNTLSISSISLYLDAPFPPEDVQLVIELKKDSLNKPGTLLKTSRLSAMNIGSSPNWYKLSYGLNNVPLSAGKYWIIVYLEENCEHKPRWINAEGYSEGTGATAEIQTSSALEWNNFAEDFAFKVSTQN
ncbi:hypothetical protein KJ780_01475 [Candidatus Micrarchaeota archaeon]|nr:hypothetical protein [Candidatus Micrarchaeota archaeon]